jgi:hypothetical protein
MIVRSDTSWEMGYGMGTRKKDTSAKDILYRKASVDGVYPLLLVALWRLACNVICFSYVIDADNPLSSLFRIPSSSMS